MCNFLPNSFSSGQIGGFLLASVLVVGACSGVAEGNGIRGSGGGGGQSSGGSSSSTGTSDTGSGSTSTGAGQGTGGIGAGGGATGSGGGGATGSGGAATGGAATGADSGRGSGGGGASDSGGVSGPLIPAQGALLGAFVGTGTLAQLETTIGRKLAITHSYSTWAADFTTRLATTLAGGRIPLVTWEPWTNSIGIPLDDIINGVHDTMIQTRAQSAKNVGGTFFLRWGHEMNGNWYPWDGFHNGANAAGPAKYVSAYRHIHDIFTAAGATNVLWVLCPNSDNVPNDAWNQWSAYYPGDSYVDWMGVDGYNWGDILPASGWRPFSMIFGTLYPTMAATGKPILISETSSAEAGGDKAAWIAGILPALRSSFPAIKGLVWFHINKETVWTVDSTPASAAAFVTMANDPYFNP
jgi:Glycosyl hydrolase family 26